MTTVSRDVVKTRDDVGWTSGPSICDEAPYPIVESYEHSALPSVPRRTSKKATGARKILEDGKKQRCRAHRS